MCFSWMLGGEAFVKGNWVLSFVHVSCIEGCSCKLPSCLALLASMKHLSDVAYGITG